METENTDKQIHCAKCGRAQYLLKYDGQIMQLGNVQIYNSVRYSCVCGFVKTWFASPIREDRKGFDGDTREILNGLGLENKFMGLRQPKKKKSGE
jgi:hypothetical protein